VDLYIQLRQPVIKQGSLFAMQLDIISGTSPYYLYSQQSFFPV
jgi:hypothetical protein